MTWIYCWSAASLAYGPVLFLSVVSAWKISVQNLSVRFSPSIGSKLMGNREMTSAIKNETFAFNSSQVVGVIGDSGSGKSCLLKCFAGKITPSGGSIKFCGVDEMDGGFAGTYLHRSEVANMMDSDMSVGLNLRHAFENRASCNGDISELVDAMSEMWSISHLRDHPIRRLSKSEQYRYALARSTSGIWTRGMDPARVVLGLDELLEFEDLRVQRSVEYTLKEVVRLYRLTALFISHKFDHVVRLSSGGHVIHLSKGEVLQMDAPGNIEYLKMKRQSYRRTL